jgi:type VI protein secretion system component VasK
MTTSQHEHNNVVRQVIGFVVHFVSRDQLGKGTPAMRKLIAMAVIGASAAIFSATAPAQAMTAGSAGVAKAATPQADSNVQEVRRRYHRHRHYHRHRYHRNRHWRGRGYYRPYYYGGYSPYYGYRYHRRPRVGIYFGF